MSKPDRFWFWTDVDGRAAVFSTPRTAKDVRWAHARHNRVGGPFDTIDEALAEGDDARSVCRTCSHGFGRHVCASCQAAILPAVLVASVAVGGAR